MLLRVRTLPNRFHASIPVNANKKYGSPFGLGILAIFPNTTVNTPDASSGCNTTQITPSAVCLYRTFRSRPASVVNSSRNRQISAALMATHPRGGRIVIVGTVCCTGGSIVAGVMRDEPDMPSLSSFPARSKTPFPSGECYTQQKPMTLAFPPSTPKRRPAPALPRMTEDQFVQWCDDQTWAEWINGEVLLKSPVNIQHGELFVFLLRLLGDFVEHYDLGSVMTEPVHVRFANPRRRRSPDTCFIAAARHAIIR